MALHVTLFAAFPSPDGYVNDYAAVLTEDDKAYLEDFLKTLEAETSAEVAIVTVSSLEGLTIEEYASRLFAEWGIGQREQDNGVLLLVAPADRAVRIEVGYGVEPILPDGLAGEIIRTEMLPEFKIGNLRRGIGRGVNRISQIIRRDSRAVAPPTSNLEPQSDRPPAVFIVPFFGIFTALGGFVAGLAVATRTFGPLLWSGMFVGIPLVIATEMVSVLSLVVLMCFGLCAMLVGRRSGRSPYWQSVLRTGLPGSVSDDEPRSWVMGGADGSSTDVGSSTSHGSSGSDFGGGSSGGGGASGRW